MFIFRTHKNNKGKISNSVVLAQSYRENGKSKHRIISSLSRWPEHLIEQFELLLKGGIVCDLDNLSHKQGKSFGAIYVIKQICDRMGITKALGNDPRERMLSLFQIMGRIISHGSRLFMAQEWKRDQAIEELLGTDKFNEDDLYENLDWLCDHQSEIEDRLFKVLHPTANGQIKTIYLYDVTSTYLEGKENELADYGYNRDGKKGKMQIVYGLLCDEDGYPVSVEVFKGNTNDTKTVPSQLEKLKERFKIEHVVFVGDKGMIKKQEIEKIDGLGWHYITSITKPQIHTLINQGVIQLALFDIALTEVELNGIRYILHKNPDRTAQIEANRRSRISYIEKKIEKKNIYLKEHARAKIETGLKHIMHEIKRRKLEGVITVKDAGGQIEYEVHEEKIIEIALLDGCYVIKTDVPGSMAKTEIIHDRYKDLALVEHAFRTIKTGLEEVQPLYVRKEKRTRGHVFICMIAYIVTKYIWEECKNLKITLIDIIETLDKINYITYLYKNKQIKVLPIELHKHQKQIFERLKITLPQRL